jgi:hypothetical protein
VTPYAALNIIVNLLKDAGLGGWLSFREPYWDSIKRESTAPCVMPGGFTSHTPFESSGGRLGMYRFTVRMFVDPKGSIDGDDALKMLLDTFWDKILDALCLKENASGGTVYFQGPIFFTGTPEPGKTKTDKDSFTRHLDFNFMVKLGQ